MYALVSPEELDRELDPEVLKKLGVELPKHEVKLSERVREVKEEELAEVRGYCGLGIGVPKARR